MAGGDLVVSIPTTEVITDLRSLDDHLADLHRRAAGSSASTGGVPVARALLLNLIVYVRTEAEAEEATASVSEISGTHPCRAIVLQAMPPRPGEPPAIVSAVCGISERGDRQLCGEIITMHVTPGRSQVAGTLLPLLMPDVPVFAWAPGDVPTDDEDFGALVSMADRVMLDSRRFRNLAAGLRALPGFCTRDQGVCIVADLAWMSLQPWRELVAQHFDPPHSRQYLSSVERIDVSFARGEREGTPPSPALLLASWFMRRTGIAPLGAERMGSGGISISALQGDHGVEVHLSPTGRGLIPGGIAAFVVRANASEGSATFVVKSVSMTDVVVTEQCPRLCLPPQELELLPLSEAQLAAQAIGSRWRDPVYEEALSSAVDVLTILGE